MYAWSMYHQTSLCPLINTFSLFGITSMQTYIYYERSQMDGQFLKRLVGFCEL